MITSSELKKKYLNYFEKRGHAVIPSASLIPQNDPTVLFTTAGMQPLVPYLIGEKHPAGNRLTDVQKCVRTGDIDDVGDDWHLTFFEMLGNWSLGDYFKKEAIEMSFEFLTKELNIPMKQLAVSCFVGDDNAPKDDESAKIWQSLGVAAERIAFLGQADNWWGPAGQTGPCGPDTEIFYWSGQTEPPKKFDPQDKHWVEIWNNVFMQYNKTENGRYEELNQKNVDTGMGLERTTAILNGDDNVFTTDNFIPIVSGINNLAGNGKNEKKSIRIIADHIRAATFILAEGIEPSNLDRGYVLRRLIRRAIRHGKIIKINSPFVFKIAEIIIQRMATEYPELESNKNFIIEQLVKEEEKFEKTLEDGLKEFENIIKINGKGKNPKTEITGHQAFILFSTYGFPLEIIKELAAEKGLKIDETEFNKEFKNHQELSRTATAGRFKGGLADQTEETKKLHTAAHLLLAALRKILGDHVYQKGSNITAERLRFDFSHVEKLTTEQKEKIEAMVNEQITKNITVKCEEMTLDEAKKRGAMGIFGDKYGQTVKVYSINNFSCEICGGPHAENTGQLGKFKLIKEESSSSGVRRIKATLS